MYVVYLCKLNMLSVESVHIIDFRKVCMSVVDRIFDIKKSIHAFVYI